MRLYGNCAIGSFKLSFKSSYVVDPSCMITPAGGIEELAARWKDIIETDGAIKM